MFKEAFQDACNAGQNKLKLLHENPAAYFTCAMMAGIFVAIGAFACYSAGALLKAADSPATKIVMAAVFAIALSLVIAAGSELFTGNCFVLSAASLNKTISWKQNASVALISYLGNFVGSIIAVAVFVIGGSATGATGEMFAASAAIKIAYTPAELIMRAILCNILVCLGVWCSIKLKSESAKLIMAFWCIFAFMLCGGEHSVANMAILTVGYLNSAVALPIGGYVYNLALSTFGNIIGGTIFVALPYYLISKDTSKTKC